MRFRGLVGSYWVFWVAGGQSPALKRCGRAQWSSGRGPRPVRWDTDMQVVRESPGDVGYDRCTTECWFSMLVTEGL